MNLTTRGRYAVMAMVDLALNFEKSAIKLQVISERQSIALNYLEQIFANLRKAEIVKSVRGPGGGYLLAKKPNEIKISDIILAVDEQINMTRCGGKKGNGCVHKNSRCLTHDLWDGLGVQIFNYLNTITLKDVCDGKVVINKELDFEGKRYATA